MNNIIEFALLKRLVPYSLFRVVGHGHKVRFSFPFGVEGEKVGAFVEGADRAGDMMVRRDESCNDMNGHKAIGASDKSVRHFGKKKEL